MKSRLVIPLTKFPLYDQNRGGFTMCYVTSGNDIHSTGDLQVLISDTLFEREAPFTFDEIKESVFSVANDGYHLEHNLNAMIEALLFSTLTALMKRKMVVFRDADYLQYVR